MVDPGGCLVREPCHYAHGRFDGILRLDAIGQRLIVLGGTWLLLIVSLLPGAIAGGIVWFALRLFIGTAALVPAALVCTVVVGLEVLLATEAIGPAYDRLDLLAVERVE